MARTHERRTERSTAEEVAEIERQLWEFAKRPDPPGVPEATLRPGAFLYRVHRVWHSLGRGTGMASHSFRALRDELLKRDPPVRNLQPKLYGNTTLSLADASNLIDVILETWHVTRTRSGSWQVGPIILASEALKTADARDLDTIRENLLHSLFKGEDQLLMEEPVGVPPEIFFEDRGRSSLALILPTKGETIAQLSPSNAYGGFSELIGRFFDAALEKNAGDQKSIPLLIWVLRLPAIRDNPEFHQTFHALAVYAASLTNWYFRLSRQTGKEREKVQAFWELFLGRSAFVVYGLPEWRVKNVGMKNRSAEPEEIDDDLYDLDLDFFLPPNIPVKLSRLPHIRRHKEFDYNLTVSIERSENTDAAENYRAAYWLFPERPPHELDETAETTGLPVIDAEISPGRDFNLANAALYEAVAFRFGLNRSARAKRHAATLMAMGWAILSAPNLQQAMAISQKLACDKNDTLKRDANNTKGLEN
ncbi:MAG: hypothetical protein OEU92_03075 [Alphaproteobacteria bacterium]|nr:hypothetical protein [Alphaproteobacteria bacterium]